MTREEITNLDGKIIDRKMLDEIQQSEEVKAIRDKDPKADLRWKMHGSMILFFLAGGIFSTLLCEAFSVRAIWGSVPVLLYTFIRLMIADRTYERDLLAKVPRGHS